MECRRNGFFVAGLCICLAAGAAVVAAPERTVRAAVGGTASAGRAAPDRPQHDQELDDLRRRDAARDLKARGLTTRWQDHDLGELLDWRDRIDAAQALANDFGVKIDWRSESAAALADMRLRAAKAAEMRASYGIIVDWRRYSWTQIEGLRLSLVAMQPGSAGGLAGSTAVRGGAASAAIPTGARDPDALVPFDPSRRTRRLAMNPRDPDAIFEPFFAWAVTSRATRRFATPDPDGLLEPTFPRRLPRPSDRTGDDLVAPGSRR
jgi:hypothetical protein